MWPFKKKNNQPEIEAPKAGVKLECPTCKQALEKYSKSRFKCPHCGNWICFWDGRLVTQEEKNCLREERQKKYYEEGLKEGILSSLGLTFKEFKERESKLTSGSGVPPKEAAVIMSLFNENMLKTKNLRQMEQRYLDVARYLNRMAEDSFHLQKAAAHARLAALKKEKFSKVYILTMNNCDACRQYEASGPGLEIRCSLERISIGVTH